MTAEFDWIIGIDGKRRPKPKAKRPPRPATNGGEPARVPDSFYADTYAAGLSPQQADVVAFLCSVGAASSAEIARAVLERDDKLARKHVKVVMVHARSKLEAFGWTISRGRGGHHALPTASRYYLERFRGHERKE